MLVDDLRRRLRRRPFVPFRVHLADGRVFDIQYPDINALGETIFSVGIPEVGVPEPFAERLEFVYVSDIRRLEPEEAAEVPESGPASNGPPSRRPAVSAKELLGLLRQRPFRPFRVHLADGRVFDIQNPEMNTLGEVIFGIGTPEQGVPDPFIAEMEFVYVVDIQRVEVLGDPSPAVPA